MFSLFPVTAVDAWIASLLAAFSQAGTVLTIGIFVSAAFLATRCK